LNRFIALMTTVAIVAGLGVLQRERAVLRAAEAGCPDAADPDSAVLICDDFEDRAALSRWSIGSTHDTWPTPEFILCGNGSGFQDRCAAWSNHLVFDDSWGYRGFDGRRSFPPQNEFYVRWYQYVSDGYTWGSLEDSSVMLHDPTDSIKAYVATSRDDQPAIPSSGPGMPFLANCQDPDWPETGGEYTRINRYQNQGNDITLQTGRWYLFEWYVRLNTPGEADGETKLWIDDATSSIVRQTLRLHYTDMRWLRSGDEGKQFSVLRLAAFHQRCDDSNTCPPDGPLVLNQSQRWDRIVISKAPIGAFRPPVVTIASPRDGAIVAGIVPVTAGVATGALVAGVQFKVDDVALGPEDRTAPYSVPWNTNAFGDGAHVVTAVVRDTTGNRVTSGAITATVANSVTVTRIEDTSTSITYTHTGTWIEGYADDRGWSGGTAALGFAAGQHATLRFSGTGASWIGFRGPQTGIADVYLDDVHVATVDTYDETETMGAVLYSVTGLVPGPHTLTVSVPNLRAKNDASADYFIVVDAFDVIASPAALETRIEETNAGIAYAGTWAQGNTARSWSGRTAALATRTAAVAQATLNFSGDGVRWIGFRGPQTGVANVYLDGTLMTTVDTYAATEELGAVLFSAVGLVGGAHTLVVEANGTKNPLSTDPFVVVDAFDIAGADAADVTPPTVGITWPRGGAVVSSLTPVTAVGADNLRLAGVQFFVDGVAIGAEDTTPPYSIAWQAAVAADGQHTLTAVARDVAGNVTVSAPVLVEVANGVRQSLPTTRFESTDRSITYVPGVSAPGQPSAWFHGSRSRNWSGGTASFNRSVGARATFPFVGTGASAIGFRAFWAGIALVYLDDVFVAEVDLFLPRCTTEQRLQGCRDEIDQVPIFTASGLAAGSHTLTVEATGRKNALAADNAVVVDAFDVAPATAVQPLGQRLEETAVSYTSDWIEAEATRPWSGGTAATAASAGARATATFTGTEVRWIGLRGPHAGFARVFLDGAFHAEVDLYSAADMHGIVYEATGLTAGRHEFTVEATGLKNAAATNSLVTVDAFDVRSRVEDRDHAVAYTGTWVHDNMDRAWSGTSASAGAGTAARSAVTGARAEFTFTGTDVRWIGFRGPLGGVADVSLDGVVVERVDLYSPVEELQVPVFMATNLGEGPHTLAIQVTGLRNTAAIGAFVFVDAFDVTLPPLPPMRRFQQVDPGVAYVTSGWTQGTVNNLFSGRTGAISAAAGARVEFTFTGSAVRWLGHRRRDGGIALVYVDGVLVGEVDTFASTQDEFQSPVLARSGLPAGTHTLAIEVAGRKRGGDTCTPSTGASVLPPCSAGYVIQIDAFEVQ
jgi:hypothetical protein